MVQSVELVLDAAADAAVRHQWDLLARAGLPSLAHHTAPSNRPHVTLAALPEIDPACEPALAGLCSAALPLDVRLGAPVVFGRDPYVLVRLVVPTASLLALHRDVAATVATPPDTNLSPDRWTPHVTLARRMPGDRLTAALHALRPVRDEPARCVGVRRWDGDARREWPVAP